MVALVTWALVLALLRTGSAMLASTPIMLMTTSSSMSVNPARDRPNRLNAEFIEGILCDRAIRGLTATRMRLPDRTGRKLPAGETTSMRWRQPVDDHLTGRRRAKLF